MDLFICFRNIIDNPFFTAAYFNSYVISSTILISTNFIAMKIAILLFALALIQLSSAGTLVSGPHGSKGAIFDPKECSIDVDQYIRDKYWYYLPDAQLCYIAHIRYKGGFLFIHQYRNYIGTFMAISKFIIPFRKIKVVTFVRLGDGVQTSFHKF